MFVRAGAIIPMGPEIKYVGEKPFDPITLAIYPDEKGSAATTVYEDDGTSPAYERGVFRRTAISITRRGGRYVARATVVEGNYNPPPRKFRFVVKPSSATSVTVLDTSR
jgi:alpha-glucosidase (family GH31 glycosyl hydrolase)